MGLSLVRKRNYPRGKTRIPGDFSRQIGFVGLKDKISINKPNKLYMNEDTKRVKRWREKDTTRVKRWREKV